MGTAGERAVWARVALGDSGTLDLITARFERHRYAPHAHAEFTLGVCVGGSEIIDHRGTRLRPGPGSLVVLAPGETHTGRPGGEAGYAYRALYPAPGLLAEATAGVPHFREPLIDDRPLARALCAVHEDLAAGRVDALEAESRLAWLLAALARRHGRGTRAVDDAPRGEDAVAGALRRRLTRDLTAPPTLGELAAGLGLSRYQALRAFRRATGQTPYAWLAQHRVTRARALLAAGHRPAEVAGLVGFADQAHLTRWFRRVLGVTPAAFRNSVQDVRGVRARDSRA